MSDGARAEQGRPLAGRSFRRSETDLFYARWQMGLSLAFHIIFAVVGMAMPLMMVVAHTRTPALRLVAAVLAKD